MKKNILFIMHVPPPVHGQAIIGRYIKSSALVNETFNCTYINLSTSTTNESVGKNGIKKCFTLLKIAFSTIVTLSTKKYDLCYITPAARCPAFYKDLFVIAIVKAFGVRVLYHFHSKGVADSSNRHFHRNLYKYAF